MKTLQELLIAFENAHNPDRSLDCWIQLVLVNKGTGAFKTPEDWIAAALRHQWNVPYYTQSVDACRNLARKVLPGFWVSSGICGVSGHASIGPDYNGAEGDRLRQEWPEADFHSGFDADLAPGPAPHRECYAVLHCIVQALIAEPTGNAR